MPRLTRKLPSYRLHKGSGQAVVTLDGRDHYLGTFGTPESRAEYDRLMVEWLAARRLKPPTPDLAGDATPGDITIHELLLAFWRHAERHYRTPSGKASSELGNYRDTIRPLKQLYGFTPAREFSPLKLKALRGTLVASGLNRTTINQRVGRIVRIFKWASSEELVPVAVYRALGTVGGLQKGRTDAKKSEPICPVPDADVDAVRPHVSRQVWAMIELQRLTGMRPGEVCDMRSCDIDVSGNVWVYSPSDHKMAYRGRERRVYLGPRAQAVLRPWLRAETTGYLFSPAEAKVERLAALRAVRKTRVQPSQADRKKSDPKRLPGARYSARSYHHAVQRACKKAGVPHWHPNQLRHSAATRLRKGFGLDVARAVLGHSSTAVTEVYAQLDGAEASAAMEQVG